MKEVYKFFLVATCNGSPVLKMNDVGNRVNVSFSRKESSLFPGRYLAGTEAFFTCFDSRFQLRGTSSSICDNNGSWTILTSPICGIKNIFVTHYYIIIDTHVIFCFLKFPPVRISLLLVLVELMLFTTPQKK